MTDKESQPESAEPSHAEQETAIPKHPNAQIQIINAIMPQLFGLVREFQGAFDGVGQKVRDEHRGSGMQKLNFIYGMLTALAVITRDRDETEIERDFADLQVRHDNISQVLWNIIEQHHDGEVSLLKDPKGLADNPEIKVSMSYGKDGLLCLRTRVQAVPNENIDEEPKNPQS